MSQFLRVFLPTLDVPYKNLSWTTVNEIQTIISQVMKRDVVSNIKASDYFSIMIDESTDITIDKGLSICVSTPKELLKQRF